MAKVQPNIKTDIAFENTLSNWNFLWWYVSEPYNFTSFFCVPL